jgi:hypothetical protein
MRITIALVTAALWGSAVCYAAAAPATSLTFSVYPSGVGKGVVERYLLRCGPAGGSVPHPGTACKVLNGLQDPFAPVPAGTICTDLALGPQVALVTGRLHGRTVSTKLTVAGGCEINRWQRLAAVVPGFPGHP